jgi:hypothetical protein
MRLPSPLLFLPSFFLLSSLSINDINKFFKTSQTQGFKSTVHQTIKNRSIPSRCLIQLASRQRSSRLRLCSSPPHPRLRQSLLSQQSSQTSLAMSELATLEARHSG